MLNDDLVDIATRHQVYLERLKAGEVKATDAVFRALDKRLRDALAKLASSDLGAATARERARLLQEVKDGHTDEYQKRLDELVVLLHELAKFEREFELDSLNEVTSEDVAPQQEKEDQTLWAIVAALPMTEAGVLLSAWLGRWVSHESQRAQDLIRRAFAEGWTSSALHTAFKGTKEAAYSDGLFASAKRNTATVIETAIQHVASAARAVTQRRTVILPRGVKISDGIEVDGEGVVRRVAKRYRELAEKADIRIGTNVKLKGYRWMSILDSRTSQICRSLDHRVFQFGKGPLPPAHPRCRSSIVAELQGRWQKRDERGRFAKREERRAVGAQGVGTAEGNLSYYDWLKSQPAAFQDDALGPTRAKLFRDGGLSAETFAKLNLGRNFEPLTLEEMRRLAPRAFERAGL